MSKFAKIFETDDLGQILCVIRDEGEGQVLVVSCQLQGDPPRLFESRTGSRNADDDSRLLRFFDIMTEEDARVMIAPLILMASR